MSLNSGLITYANKSALNVNSSIADANKVNDSDMNQIKTAINSGLLDLLMPVGHIIYNADSSFDPNVSFGGTWVKRQGVFLFGADTNHALGTTGGNLTHTLSVSEMPAHSHQIWNGNVYQATINGAGSGAFYNISYSDLTNQGGNLIATTVGGSQPFDIMPPYKAVNIWERTA